jgi:hypothetical protein
VSQLTVRAVNFDNVNATIVEEPGQSSAIGAGAFHPYPHHWTEPFQPLQQLAVTGFGSFE